MALGGGRLAGAFLLGLVAGSLAMVPVGGREVERLAVACRQLALRLGEAEQDLARLRSQGASWTPVVRRVTVRFPDVADEALRVRLEEAVRPLLEELVGREVGRLDPFLVDALLRGRRVQVGEQEYGLALRRALLGEETLVVLGAEPFRRQAPFRESRRRTSAATSSALVPKLKTAKRFPSGEIR